MRWATRSLVYESGKDPEASGASALFVGVYEPVKQTLSRIFPENLSALAHFVVKQRIQTGQFTSPTLAVRYIASLEGIKGLYAGYGSFLLRDLSFDAIQFCIYEQLRIGYMLAPSNIQAPLHALLLSLHQHCQHFSPSSTLCLSPSPLLDPHSSLFRPPNLPPLLPQTRRPHRQSPLRFFVSNAIIAALFANSRRVIGHNSDGRNVDIELFLDFTKRNADQYHHDDLPSEVDSDQSRVSEQQVECQDKQMVSDNTTTARTLTLTDQVELDARTDSDSIAELEESDSPKVYRRSQSDNLTAASRKEVSRNLRRSETEKCRETARTCENPRENLYAHDNLSNEEFQRTIEAFIARQMRFLREE
ncbi:hypothetical protein K1719_019393 [Acacia pycnantha]|nr:hypothetical protein K1719_019393 [Acacia pycnantha]